MPVDIHTLTAAAALATESHENTPPDISYIPDRDRWFKRTAQRLVDDPTLLSTPLPEGFPQKLDSPLVWEGKDWKNESQWVYNLNAADLKEIDEAVHHFHGNHRRFSVAKIVILIIE